MTTMIYGHNDSWSNHECLPMTTMIYGHNDSLSDHECLPMTTMIYGHNDSWSDHNCLMTMIKDNIIGSYNDIFDMIYINHIDSLSDQESLPIIIMNLYSAGSISHNAHRRCNVCVVTFYSI